MPAQGLHSLGFEPRVRFIRQHGKDGSWGECVVCNEAIFGPTPEALEGALDKHRELIHVVMVYPYGRFRPEPRLRRPRSERRDDAHATVKSVEPEVGTRG